MKKIIVLLCVLAMSFSAVSCGISKPGEWTWNGEYNEITPAIFRQKADYGPRNGVKKEWNTVSSYFCNYGTYQSAMLDYDVAILGEGIVGTFNKVGSTVDQVGLDALNAAGVWTIAYITLGEDYSVNIGDGMGPGGYASYYLYNDEDMPIANGNWGSYYVDPSSPAWEKIIMTEVQRLVDIGCDGIFMDTCDSVDAYPQTLSAMTNLIKKIRTNFPNIKMVLNRGFTLIPVVYEWIDGNMFELYATMYNQSTFVYEMLDSTSIQFMYNRFAGVGIVNATRQKHYYPVFSLEYFPRDGAASTKQDIYNLCWEYDFIPYLSMEGRQLGGEITDYNLRPTSERGCKALSMTDEVKVDKNGDTSEKNLAYVENDAKINTDSSFFGYTKLSLNDCYISNAENFETLGWQVANWASADSALPHFIEIETKENVKANKIVIDWAYDNGDIYSSRKVIIQGYIGGQWVDLQEVADIENNTVRTEVSFATATATNKYRIYQPQGYGPSMRRNIMWVTEVALYE